ncbi:hypothetical protein AVEN_107312-1 [Araneus ventricosus]|uniref:Uncharacterized protein n=1 Tax=Araneus ventricosus TaxID=182803 RepID=A0A4Y2DVJ9_ARAVE|nr:hypothetical protein AVEN_107312-1 [Araneus ventricosus]
MIWRTAATYTADLQWKRVSSLESSGPEAETLTLGHRSLSRLRGRDLKCILNSLYYEDSKTGFMLGNDMKPFDFKYGRKQETDDEKEKNMILLEESEDEDFGSLQQETEAAEMEEVMYLE